MGSNPIASFPQGKTSRTGSRGWNKSNRLPEARLGVCGNASVEDPAGRWPSGQWHQTVNLTDSVLRGFESLPAHFFDFRWMIFDRMAKGEGRPPIPVGFKIKN